MRSEQEIRNKINHLLTLEKEAAEDIEEAIEYDGEYLNWCIQKANALQGQRATLEWVLNEKHIEEGVLKR